MIIETTETRKLALYTAASKNEKFKARVKGDLCLFTVLHGGQKARMNFRDDKILKLEMKVKSPGASKAHRWVLVQEAPYTDIKIGEDNELLFPDKPTEEKS